MRQLQQGGEPDDADSVSWSGPLSWRQASESARALHLAPQPPPGRRSRTPSSTWGACPAPSRSSRASSTGPRPRRAGHHRPFGFKTYDVSNPTQPAAPRHLPAARDPRRAATGRTRTWRSTRAQADHRRARPASRRRRPDELPGHRHALAEEPQPEVPLGLLRHLVRGSASNLKQIGDFVELPAGHTRQLHRRLPLRLDRRPGASRRPRLPRAVHARWPRRRSADLGDRPPQPGQPKVFPSPIDLGRNDGPTDYSHDVDVDAQGIAWTSGRGGLLGYATQRQVARPADRPQAPGEAVGPGARRRWRHRGRPDGVAQPQTDFIHNSDASARQGASAPRACAKGNVVIVTEEDFTEPCDQGGRIVAADITDSIGGGPRGGLDAGEPVPDEGAVGLPPDAGRAARPRPDHRVLGALLRDRRARRSRLPGTARACG